MDWNGGKKLTEILTKSSVFMKYIFDMYTYTCILLHWSPQHIIFKQYENVIPAKDILYTLYFPGYKYKLGWRILFAHNNIEIYMRIPV